MARHLKDVSWPEFQGVLGAVVQWLNKTNVAGSVADEYNLYTALEDEWHRARAPRLRIEEDDLDADVH